MTDQLDRFAKLSRSVADGSFYEGIASASPQLSRGQVWCRTCGATRRVDSAQALRHGWPKCCTFTMTIDAPDEGAPHD